MTTSKKEYKGLMQKILIPILIVILVMICTSVYSVVNVNSMRNRISNIRSKTVKEVEAIEDVRYNVLHTAEILTDVSATHDDGGFEEAAEFRDNIRTLLDSLQTMDPERNAIWDDIWSQYENFYQLCCKMANAYINDGLDAGNEIMEQVDPVTEELSETVDSITEEIILDMESGIDKIASDAQLISMIQSVSSVIYILLILYVAFTVIRQMIKPVTEISSSLQKLASKDLTADEIMTHQKDEIGGLVFSYNALRSSLRAIMTDMDTSSGNLEEMSTSLADQSDTIMRDITDITQAINNVAELASDQANNIENALSELDALQAIAVQNEQTSNNLSDASEKISKASQEGNRVLDELYTTSKESESAFGEIFSSIEQIKISTAKISDASSMIDNIAQQTNLLSLNASIEAARAGDAGRGFAVVADEIRSLSDESARSVNEINQMIRELRKNVENANLQSETVRDSVIRQISGVEDTRNSYADIASNLSVINDEIVQLSEVSKSMTESCDTVEQAMKSLSQSAEQNAANSQETTASIEEVLELVRGIASESGQIKEGTDVLSDVVKTYQL